VQHLKTIFLNGRSNSKELIKIYFTIFGAHLITQTITEAFLFLINKRKENWNHLFENGPTQYGANGPVRFSPKARACGRMKTSRWPGSACGPRLLAAMPRGKNRGAGDRGVAATRRPAGGRCRPRTGAGRRASGSQEVDRRVFDKSGARGAAGSHSRGKPRARWRHGQRRRMDEIRTHLARMATQG
jgi:hypothetical protein